MPEPLDFSHHHQLNTAVLFLVFNRPDTTAKVFEAIRQAQPPRLYVAADGPRENRIDEAERCEMVRRIATNVDWPCEVKTLFQDKNLGCKIGVSRGISWFFESEQEGIILEDDCLPSQTFFWFCEDLLEKYRHDSRIGQICGFNYGYKNKLDQYDYFFSKYGFIWGWATWRRAWEKYDIEMKSYQHAVKVGFFDVCLGPSQETREQSFSDTYSGKINTWDYQWSFTRFTHNMLSIVPKFNTIKNLGFGCDATHTIGENPHVDISYDDFLGRELTHPEYLVQYKDFYKLFDDKNSGFFQKILRSIRRGVFK